MMIARKSIGIALVISLLVISFLVILGYGEEREKPKIFPQTYPEGVPKKIVREKDGAKMVLIPAGEFQMGTSDAQIQEILRDNPDWRESLFADEKPVHTVYLDAYYIDKYEVTVGQYKKFLRETGHRVLPDWVSKYSPTDNHPVVGVSREDAQAYCKWAGTRLPTEAEWEKAARGGLVAKKYPWGNEAPDAGGKYRANYYTGDDGDADGYEYCAPVGSFPPNGYGLYDMAGNVWEWCADWYDENYYSYSPRKNPPGSASGQHCIVRGGSWSSGSYYMRAASRSISISKLLLVPFDMYYFLGFRCCVAQDVTP